LKGVSKPEFADAVVLAIARTLKIVAGDKHFKGLNEVIWIGD